MTRLTDEEQNAFDKASMADHMAEDSYDRQAKQSGGITDIQRQLINRVIARPLEDYLVEVEYEANCCIHRALTNDRELSATEFEVVAFAYGARVAVRNIKQLEKLI